jgi:hypothetical protein
MAADDDERPPFLRSWSHVYALVLGTLAALVLLFSILSAVYR